jgi:hypothetical protein
MPHFETFSLVKWLHFVGLAIGGGAMVVALLLSGFEEEREDLRGLAATVWKKMVTWPFRLTLILGLALWAIRYHQNINLFWFSYFHWKLLLVAGLLAMSEMAPRTLAAGKRGAALLGLLLFLLATFVTINGSAFPQKIRPAQETLTEPEAQPSLQTR